MVVNSHNLNMTSEGMRLGAVVGAHTAEEADLLDRNIKRAKKVSHFEFIATLQPR